jgi:hydroxymethylpyrimidine/phosphomethylpyrimidine kinase
LEEFILPIVLTIAGSDSGAGAGIQADLKTFSALSVYGTTAITAITAQNTLGVQAIEVVTAEMVRKQIEAIFMDMGADAVKIGMMGSFGNVEMIAGMLRHFQARNVVLDPVLVSTSGTPLLPREALNILIERLLPVADIITPNLAEAEMLTGVLITHPDDMKQAAAALHRKGSRMVLVKGGHLSGAPIDIFYDGTEFFRLESERIPSQNTHGTGCTLSSAIAAYLARGFEPLSAVRAAKKFITGAIRHSQTIGQGKGPVNQFFQIEEQLNVED